MNSRMARLLLHSHAAFLLYVLSTPATGCCPAPPSGKPVVNADQTVVIVWDAARQMQHFIRKATFHSEAEDFGFIVPTPSQPVLEESGNEAFPYLLKLTEPEVRHVRGGGGGMGCGCGAGGRDKDKKAADKAVAKGPDVKVLDTKEVAGFNAVVLEAGSAADLVQWLTENGYAYSRQIEEWARPYVEGKWKFTALKVMKDKESGKQVAAGALRISFKTDRPLFPYREPDPAEFAKELGATTRLLRIYFIADKRCAGTMDKAPWTGEVAWAGKLSGEQKKTTLDLLKLPADTGPADWHLTEFEDRWPYRKAAADVYFASAENQGDVRRPPIIIHVAAAGGDVMLFAIAALVLVPALVLFCRRRLAAARS